MIYVIGVDHFTVQLPHEKNVLEKISQYLLAIEKICRDKRIKLVAEECSQDALDHYQISVTYAGGCVSKLGIEYILCDPGFSERDIIGVKQRDRIAKELSVPFPPSTPIDENRINEVAAESDRKREKYWLEQIQRYEGKGNQVLLICGFEHVDSFCELAKKEGCEVQKLA
jgi:hypothetical protein